MSREGKNSSNNIYYKAILIALFKDYIALDLSSKSQILWSKMTYSPKDVS